MILARGLGTRMRRADPGAEIGGDQSAAADTGLKGMIPIGRPFLDYLLTGLADAGFDRVCLVIGPEHARVREHYSKSPPSRLTLQYAIQEKPLGTADAVLAAESFADGRPFVVLNSDNWYPAGSLRRLRQAHPPAIAAFARSSLIQSGNIKPDRVERFGALEIDSDGLLASITPRQGSAAPVHDGDMWASMNCWLFDSRIFEFCREVPVSPRGEYELPRAVQAAIDSGTMRFTVLRERAGVLDLSTRGDIAAVQRKLAGLAVSY